MCPLTSRGPRHIANVFRCLVHNNFGNPRWATDACRRRTQHAQHARQQAGQCRWRARRGEIFSFICSSAQFMELGDFEARGSEVQVRREGSSRGQTRNKSRNSGLGRVRPGAPGQGRALGRALPRGGKRRTEGGPRRQVEARTPRPSLP
jgi:hypothetical protein